MPYYYVTHPSLGFTSVVDAPSTEKARTTYLDYLERQGRVPRNERQHLRRNMVASRILDPGEVTADINLAYGYEEVSFAPQVEAEIVREESNEELPLSIRRYRRGIEEEMAAEHPVGELAEEPAVQVEEPRVFSPIQQASLGRYR